MTRKQIRFTIGLQVWVFIGSAYFIVITQMSNKRDIFTHHPGGDESGFPEMLARRVTQKAAEEGKHVMTEKKMAAKCILQEVRKETETWHCGRIVNEKRLCQEKWEMDMEKGWKRWEERGWRDESLTEEEKGEEKMVDRSVRLLFPSLRTAGLIWGSL